MPAENTESYIAEAAPEFRDTLTNLAAEIRALAPDAAESISYGIPTWKHRGRPLIYFGAAKAHCALYGLDGTDFPELAGYKMTKGSVHFTPKQPLPAGIVEKLIVRRRADIDAALAARGRKS